MTAIKKIEKDDEDSRKIKKLVSIIWELYDSYALGLILLKILFKTTELEK
jgi:hypothetical protein